MLTTAEVVAPLLSEPLPALKVPLGAKAPYDGVDAAARGDRVGPTVAEHKVGAAAGEDQVAAVGRIHPTHHCHGTARARAIDRVAAFAQDVQWAVCPAVQDRIVALAGDHRIGAS